MNSIENLKSENLILDELEISEEQLEAICGGFSGDDLAVAAVKASFAISDFAHDLGIFIYKGSGLKEKLEG